MKKTLIAAAAVAALSILTGAAHAQSKSANTTIYGEIGLHNVELKSGNESPSLNFGTALIGWQFHPNLAAEFFLGTGLSEASFRGGVGVKADYGTGLLLRPSFKFNDKFEAFVRLGYGHYQFSSGGISDSESSLVYGVGANYYFTDKLYGQLSYTSFLDKDDGKARGFGISLGYRF